MWHLFKFKSFTLSADFEGIVKFMGILLVMKFKGIVFVTESKGLFLSEALRALYL